MRLYAFELKRLQLIVLYLDRLSDYRAQCVADPCGHRQSNYDNLSDLPPCLQRRCGISSGPSRSNATARGVNDVLLAVTSEGIVAG